MTGYEWAARRMYEQVHSTACIVFSCVADITILFQDLMVLPL